MKIKTASEYLFCLALLLQTERVAADSVSAASWYIWVCLLFLTFGVAVFLICYRHHKAAKIRNSNPAHTETVIVHPHPVQRQQPPPPPPPLPMQQQAGGHSDPAYPPGYGAPTGMASGPVDPFKKAAYS